MNSQRMFVAAVVVALCGGCHRQPPSGEVVDPPVATAGPQELPDDPQELARAAQRALVDELSGRLVDVLTRRGPAAAIEVCQVEAPLLARQVGDQFGVTIGRTSFKLRSSRNAPPDWARDYVEQRVEDPQFVDLPDGRFGALLPIFLQARCVTCHGPREELAEEVQTALGKQYPADQATGFQGGELRGWFWVEVPSRAAAENSDPAAT